MRAGGRVTPGGSSGSGETAGKPGADDAGVADPPSVARGAAGRRRTAGIYGAIITAAILAAAGGEVSTGLLTLDVLISLFVYWTAEVYAELLGARAESATPTGRHEIRDELAVTWPMMSASFGPLAVVLVVRLLGGSDPIAASAGLGAAVALLVAHTWAAGRAARLRGVQLILMMLVATALGGGMILLKNFVLVHLH